MTDADSFEGHPETESDVPVTSTETMPGREATEVLGIARGNAVKARSAGHDLVEGIRNFTGGELKSYSELMERARSQALDRMQADAAGMGADAVVNLRFESSDIASQGAEVLAYGTAVRLE